MNKVVLITGSSRGIGKAIALRFAREGYRIALNGAHNIDALKECEEEIKAMGIPCIWVKADVSIYKEASDLFSMVENSLGPVDILVNNAGISSIGLFQDMSPSNFEEIIQTNLLSVLNCCHLAIPSMVYKKYGKIINISSVWGNVGASCEVAYSASKGGINSFTKALGKELAPSNIGVNAVACGLINTSMNSNLTSEDLENLTKEIPAGRMGQSQEVADLVYALASGHEYLTGQVLTLDGGWT